METSQNIIREILRPPVHCARFFWRRIVVFSVNLLAGPPSVSFLQALRVTLLRAIGVRTGCQVKIFESLYILNGRNVSIGAGSCIGSYCRIWDFSEIKIGCNLLASHNLTLISGTHHPHDLSSKPGPIEIGDNVWIGINVTIVGPVKIGNDSIIGAGSVVLGDIPANVVAGGIPARVLKKRERPEAPQ